MILISACAPRKQAWNPDDYTVRSGDTLYSIAWRYEIKFDDFIRWNNLTENAVIKPGQRLHTRQPGKKKTWRDTKSRAQSTKSATRETQEIKQDSTPKTVTVRPKDTLYSLSRKHDVPVKQLIRLNKLKKPYVINPGRELKLVDTGTRVKVTKLAKRQLAKASEIYIGKKSLIDWKWPIKGKVVKKFNKYLIDAKGIDIASAGVRNVKAAASGKVVYSGNGLISYGNLVIIKHDELYLSAYANNHKLLVKQGEQVKAGQTIAKLGNLPNEKPRLHFEIRKNGKPVNPLNYLPTS